MASRQTLVGKTPVGRLIGPALEKIIKNTAWRKHSKLVQQCKAVQDKLAELPDSETPSDSSSESCLFNGQFCFSPTEAEFILQPLLMACETGSIKVVEPALDCIQKLIVYSHLRGEVDDESDGDTTILSHLMESICKCHELGDDAIELAVIKTQLSAVVSFSLRIHGDYLLQIVRSCYNILLGSRNAINQIAAKASLIQMLVTVFRRMEADSSTVPVQPIVVADLMEPAEKSLAYVNMLQFVQNFISKVMQDIDAVFNQSPSLSSVGRDEAFESAADAVNGADPAELLEATDKDISDAQYWETDMYQDSAKGETGDEDSDPEGDLEVQITNKLRRDAFLVFRAVCKLSMKVPHQEGFFDQLLIRGKVLSLELLKILLENAGAVFRTNQRFLAVIKQYLCLSLLKNSALPLMNVFQLSCSIFMSLVLRFRAGLKAEIGIFFPMMVLHVLEDVAKPNFYQKMIVLRFLDKLCVDSQVLVDIFVNYDCHVDSPNIFERMVNGLLKTAQGVPQGAFTTLSPAEGGTFKFEAIKCLVSACRSMGVWMNQQLHIPESHLMKISEVGDLNAETGNSGSLGNAVREDAVNGVQPHAETVSERSEAATFEQRRAYKLELQEGITLFNRKPCKGIEFLVKSNKVGNSAEEIATFLKNASGLDQTMIGDYLGEREGFALRVMYAYVDSFNFEGMEFDEAIRSFLQGFRLPGEAQKIDRIMEKFAERYCKCNPKAFTSADTAYVLAYSVIMLNTDAHNPMVKNKMSKADFIRNNRGIDDGKDLSEVYLGSLYDRIVKKEIKMKADNLALRSKQPSSVNKILGLDNILNIVIRRRGEEKPLETSDDLIKHMQEQFKAKTGKSDSIYYAPTDVEILRFMVDVCWAPMLAAFSVTLDQSEDKMLTSQCLEGFRLAIHITAVMCMQTQRDAFVTSLAKFTSLHSAADIKEKNIDALKVIISIADEDGNHLQDAWEHILTCLSRLDHLHLLGEGAPPDASFFTVAENDSEKAEQSVSPVFHAPKRKGSMHFQHSTAAAAAARRSAYDSAGGGGNAPAIVTTEQMNNLASNLNLLEQIGSFEMNRIFTRSQRLNSEAIVDFVKALCKVSMEELQSPTNPRIFSLTKIVEIAHYNMNRIRLVWSRIWNVLSNFFVTVGCSENLSVAIFAMDSLRQLAMKFLEREELANYNFQNEFMKPFVIVMRKSSSVEIRELIIRCVSQMVLVRVKNVKSGWKSMFMIFSTAASDDNRNILLLAFETIEKIVRDYFPYITETETTTFTDCVNCLIAFTKNKFDKDVSLNAIAFLRFSALKLAEGGFTSSVKSKAKEKSDMAPPTSSTAGNDGNLEGPKFTDKDDHLYFWFPLLAGLSKLAFNPRPDIRKSALQVLFDTLLYHGHLFSPALWDRVFESVIFPIFDSIGHPSESVQWREHGYHSENKNSYLEENALISEVCPLALQLVVDLFVKFYNLLNSLLGKVLALLISFIKQRHPSLEDVGVDSFVRLISNAGKLFSEDEWQQVLLSLKAAAAETLSDFADIVYTMDVIERSIIEEEYPMASHTELLAGTRTIEEMEEGRVGLLQTAIAEAKCCKKVQHRLVEVVMEIYNLHGGDLSAENTVVLLDVLHYIAAHAHEVNSDHDLRSKLQQVCHRGQMPDPPLLHLERESYQAYLKLLLNLARDKSTCAKEVEVEGRLVEVCEEVLRVYINTASSGEFSKTCNAQLQPYWEIPLGPARREELAFRAPLIVATLQAISGLKDTPVEKHLSRFFPLLINLVSCEHGSGEVQLALSDMFRSWIAPILLKA